MRAARVVAPYEIEYAEVDDPTMSARQVLLQTRNIGICASDQQIYHGLHRFAHMPLIMGHEVSASVADVGAEVSGFRVGDLVCVQPQVSCGTCYPCQMGRPNVCEDLKIFGVHLDGFACEYEALEPHHLHRVPGNVAPEIAVLVEPLSVAVGSVRRSGRVDGGNVLVMGAGTIGNLVAQAAKGFGAGKVMIADINQCKLDLAKSCGIEITVNTQTDDLGDAIRRAFGARRADVIVDCVALPAVFGQILELARPASDIVITGNYKAAPAFDVPMLQRREITMIGHMMYVSDCFDDAIRLLAQGQVRTEGLITQRFAFSQYRDAFSYADTHPLDVMKMIVTV